MGLSVFATLNFAALYLVGLAGLPFDYEHEPTTTNWGSGAESESDGGVMTYVLALLAASAMVAYRVGLPIGIGSQAAKFAPRESATFNVWLAGLLAVAGASAAAQYVFANIGQMLDGLVSMAAAALIAFAGHGWWQQRMREIDAREQSAKQLVNARGRRSRKDR